MSIKKTYLTSKPECKVTFKLGNGHAKPYKKVSLVGEFNGWDEKMNPMKKLKSGDFSITVNLDTGKSYQYKFLADGSDWLIDEEADQQVTNEFAGQNSLVEI